MATESQRRYIVELSFIKTFADQSVASVEKGRLQTLMKRLKKEVDKAFSKIRTPLSQKEIQEIGIKLDKFGKITGWDKRGKHYASTCSFCMDLIERSDHHYSKKTIDTLNEIMDYFARQMPWTKLFPCCNSGAVTADKWESLFA